MKKLFTLLFVVGMFAAAQAQPGNRDNRQPIDRNDHRDFDDDDDYAISNNPNTFDRNGNAYGRDNRYESRFAAERRMKMEIAQINREFDHKIEHIRDNFYMPRYVKQRQIHDLEHKRQHEIDHVYEKYSRFRFDNRKYQNKRRF